MIIGLQTPILLLHSSNLFFQETDYSRYLGCLHIGAIDSSIKKDKVIPLLNLLQPLFESSFTLSQQIAIDESVIAFKGRVSFRQYMKGKPHPWGIKAFVSADSVTGFLYCVIIYFGKQTDLSHPDLPHTARVVLILTEGLNDKGHDLYIDRFYNAPLVKEKNNSNWYVHVSTLYFINLGTVMSKRRGLPDKFSAKRKKGTVVSFFCDNMLADKRQVLMLSSRRKHTKKVKVWHTEQLLKLNYTVCPFT